MLAELAPRYQLVPLFALQFFTPSTEAMLRPLDESTKQIYKTSTATFIEKYKPKYLGIGIEVNVLYEKSPSDFEAFVQFYSELYQMVKAKSPATMVFTIFQLEKMKGLRGGLFGGTNDPAKAEWALLERFSDSDIAAFTTYPGLIYKTPAEIPQDYYNEIKRYTKNKIAFTEIGWHSLASPPGWESSDAEQAQFVTSFFSLSKELNVELALWSFMYDQNVIEPFKGMGLRQNEGTAKPAWDEWLSAK